MRDTEDARAGCAALKRGEAYLHTLSEQMPAMNKIFTILADGYTPTFLDIIAGISEMVAFQTDHDLISDDRFLLSEKMSGKKCLFCS